MKFALREGLKDVVVKLRESGKSAGDVTTGGGCHQETSYSTEYYSCIKTRSYKEWVRDYDVDANIVVVKNVLKQELVINE